jgi:hypothetical protein
MEGRKPFVPAVFLLQTLQSAASRCTDYAIPVHLLTIRHHNLYRHFHRILENSFLLAYFLNMTFFGHDCKIFYYRYFVIGLQINVQFPCQYHSTNAPYSSSLHYTYQKDKPAKQWNLPATQYSFTFLGALSRRGL